ncbi:hypothetical protein GGU11DRAFT_761352 [Lentinula aff. detonsa]|nr:hypothetical protein GGU11DRAFT_761352 [Lentinula aff. detonsa]
MITDAKLGAKWWCEAFAAATHPGTIPEENWTKKRQDVGHLRVWGCVYQGKIAGSDEVLRTRDIVFVEGHGHWTSEVEGENEEDMDLRFLTTSTLEPNVSDRNQSQFDNVIIKPDQNKDSTQGHANDNPQTHQTQPSHINPTNTEPTRRSTRNKTISRAMAESLQYLKEERHAKQQEEKWANDETKSDTPILPEDDEEINALIAQNEPLAKEPDNKWVPLTYDEATTQLDLWGPALEKEIGRLDE